MATKLEIWNMALDVAGSSVGVADPDENSFAAQQCRKWYDQVVRDIQSSAPWPALRAYSRLALEATRDFSAQWTNADPNPSYSYAFAAPQDLLIPYHLESFARFEYSANTISCNEQQPILYYNKYVANEADWGSQLTTAIVHYLGAMLTGSISGVRQKRVDNFNLARDIVESNQVKSAGVGRISLDVLPDWLAVRSGYPGTFAGESPKYYFPMRTLQYGYDT